MDKFYFVKWIDVSSQKDAPLPVQYDDKYPIFQFTQKENHNALRPSQCHKTVFVTPNLIHPNTVDVEPQSLKNFSCKKLSSNKLYSEINKLQNENEDDCKSKFDEALQNWTYQSALKIDFYLNFNVVASAVILWNIKSWEQLQHKKLYLWTSTISLRHCQNVSNKSARCVSDLNQNINIQTKANIYKSRIKYIRYHCIEVENQLELTSKHKGVIHLLSSDEFITGAGEVWVDHIQKQVIMNNQSGSLRFQMSFNGYLLFMYSNSDLFFQRNNSDKIRKNRKAHNCYNIYDNNINNIPCISNYQEPNNSDVLFGLTGETYTLSNLPGSLSRINSWKEWNSKRTDKQKQLDCPFLNYFIMPSVGHGCLKKHYKFCFDREIKEKKAVAVDLQYIRHVIEQRTDIHSEIHPLFQKDKHNINNNLLTEKKVT